MGLLNFFLQRKMAKEAKRIAQLVKPLYEESKSNNPDATEQRVIQLIIFDDNELSAVSTETRQRIIACCETIQGLCYMMALDIGKFKNMMNFRSLQFTQYMDLALREHGFPDQSKEQKERVLEAMELNVDGWEKYAN